MRIFTLAKRSVAVGLCVVLSAQIAFGYNVESTVWEDRNVHQLGIAQKKSVIPASFWPGSPASEEGGPGQRHSGATIVAGMTKFGRISKILRPTSPNSK